MIWSYMLVLGGPMSFSDGRERLAAAFQPLAGILRKLPKPSRYFTSAAIGRRGHPRSEGEAPSGTPFRLWWAARCG
jgi:hypothetical protein